MKGSKQGQFTEDPTNHSSDQFTNQEELDIEIREAAASFVNDVIFKAKEMAQRSYQHQPFSVVEEEDEEALLAEEMANRPPPLVRMPSFPGATPEIQIDLVGDRTPSPVEETSYVAPVYQRNVKIKHRSSSTSSGSESDEELEATNQRNQVNHKGSSTKSKDASRKPAAASEVINSSSKRPSLPFVDETPPEEKASPLEAEGDIAERLAASRSPQPPSTPISKEPLKQSDEELRSFVSEYIRGLTEQALALAHERQTKKSISTGKYSSPTDEQRASVILTVKSSDGPWYNRFRNAVTRCLQVGCFCLNIKRDPEPVAT